MKAVHFDLWKRTYTRRQINNGDTKGSKRKSWSNFACIAVIDHFIKRPEILEYNNDGDLFL